MDNELVLSILKILFPAGIGSISTGLLIFILVLLFPEKVEKWQGIIWGWIEKAGIFHKRASKEKIRHSIQGSVGNFAQDVGHELPEFDRPGVKIEWVENRSDRKAFIDQGKAVIRLKKEDPDHENTVTACMLFVSQILLRKSVRYLSPTQRDSIELFTGYKMLERETPEIFNVFVEKWLYPGIEKSNEKVSEYFDRFKRIDEAEFFFPVFLQEMIYLGDKVYARKRDDRILHEVDGALEFLEVYAARRRGQRIDRPYYSGESCRFAIMIVGLSVNIEDERYDVYLKHIKDVLIPCGVETVYLIGPSQNKAFIHNIARMSSKEFANPFARDYEVNINDADGNKVKVTNHLSVLRKKNRVRYIS